MSHPAYGELRPVTPLASVLLAENPSPMTLEGTNSWVLRAPGSEACVVVDPGEQDEPSTWPGSPAAARWSWSCSPTATTTTPAGRAGSPS